MKHLTLLLLVLPFAFQLNLNGAVVYSGIQNIPIPTTFDGIYINLDNSATSGSTILGWDINPFFGGTGMANSTTFQPARTGTGNTGSCHSIELR